MEKLVRSSVLGLISVLLLAVAPVNAQRLCEAIVENALEEAGDNCGGLSGSQACYGYDALSPTFYDTVDGDNTLGFQGSTIELPPIHTLKGTAFDAEEDEWGVGYIQIGDDGQDVFEDGEFIRFILLGDVTVENFIEPDDEELGAFEQMYMTTGDESDCQEAVNDLVIQSPKGIEIGFTINEVPVVMGSTLVFGWGEDNGGEVMYITVLDGFGIADPDSDVMQESGLREVMTVSFADEEEPIIDPLTGEPALDADGNLLMRRYVETEFNDPVPLSEDGEGFYGLSYYETFEMIPESLLNYPIDLEAEDEPCICEENAADDLAGNLSLDESECSIETGGVIEVTFQNNSTAPIDVYWNNFECEPEYYGTIAPGESFLQDTVAGHEWGFFQDDELVSFFDIEGAGTYSYP